ncbi:MAG: ABC transporter permease [Candidatus Micrarchaeota archaeon]|nr:ABC transporter permease [Candidatus Micrarchaeota archaeon]
MGMLGDTLTLYKREMLIFKSNLRVNLVRSIMFPLVIILFFGNVGSSILNVPIAVVNYANNPQSLSLIGTLQSNNYLQITSITDQPTALNLLKNGKVQLVVIILPTFPSSQPGTPGVQVYYSNTQFSVTSFALPLISSAASKYTSNVQAGQPGGIQIPQNPAGEVSSNALYASKGSYKDFLVGGIVPMVVVFSALFGGGISLISDRQMGNLKAFFITPINKNAIVLSRILSGATQGILFAFLALTIGILDGAQLAGGWLSLALIVVVSVILSLGFIAIAVMIASKIKRVDAYAIFSQVVGLPLWFISGGILPTQSLPSWLSAISVVDPLTYANTVIRAITLQGFIPINNLLFNLGVLSVFAVVMVYMSFRVFNSSNEE